MANRKQLAILKQGLESWNKWRNEKSPESMFPNLNFVNLRGSSLKQGMFVATSFVKANLAGVDFSFANLRGVVMKNADLRQAILNRVNLGGANLREANLCDAVLTGADFSVSHLERADLSRAELSGATFTGTKFDGCNFSNATFGSNLFDGVDLRQTVGLETVRHDYPSKITTDTFFLSNGDIPEVFLRGCGLSDWEVESVKLYNSGLGNEEVSKILYRMYDLRASQALQISPLFISYSHGDKAFVDKLESQLNQKGIRYWRDIHEMKAGRVEKQIDRAISQNPTVLLVLSEHSLQSDWVQHEVRTARDLEKELGRDVLCPVALDDSWKKSRWPQRIMEQITEYNILDFSAWEDDSKFEGIFRKLIDGLELFYKA